MFTGCCRSDTASPSLLPTDPAALSIDELCRAWRLSYLELQTAHAAEALEHAVQLRRRYLDELCRATRRGFADGSTTAPVRRATRPATSAAVRPQNGDEDPPA